jgi:hypothetical protein
MKHKNKIITAFLLLTFALFNFACQKQQAEPGSNSQQPTTTQTVKAQSPTEAYKMLYAAVKAKDMATVKQLMSKGSLGLAEFSASQQKKPVENILENGLVATTLADTLSEMRPERVKGNIGAVEVYNPKDKRWEDLPFVLEDGSWKLAVGDIFQNTFDPNQTLEKSQSQIEMESSNKMMPMPANTTNFPEMTNSNKSVKAPPIPDKDKSVEVPKDDKPKK